MGPNPSSTSITDSAAGYQGLGVANKPDDGDDDDEGGAGWVALSKVGRGKERMGEMGG